MQTRLGWSRSQLLIAFKLYCELPFGRLHSRNPEIIRYAKLIDRTPSALAMKLTNIASLDPMIRSTGRTGLTGASAADKAMWIEMESDWEDFAQDIETAEAQLIANLGPEMETEIVLDGQLDVDYTGEERIVQATSRVGQNFFRRAVMSAYNYKCCITGLTVPKLLIASHIVPWRIDPGNRLNPRNGLCLSSLHDKAFDLGMITIDEQMKVRLAKKHSEFSDSFFVQSIAAYDGCRIELPQKFAPDRQFLEYHRRHVFEKC